MFAAFNPFTEEFEHWNNDIETDAAEPSFRNVDEICDAIRVGATESPMPGASSVGAFRAVCGAYCSQAPPTWGGSASYTYCIEAGGVENCQTLEAATSPNMCPCARNVRFTTDFLLRYRNGRPAGRVAAVRRVDEYGT